MPRSMVGLLVAVGTAMSALVAFAHGGLVWVVIADAAAATGLAAYLASAPSKKSSHHAHEVTKKAGSIAALTKKI
jgi:hypothetical protein